MKSFCVLWLWMFVSECKTSTTDGISIQGYVGRNVIISCSHSWASNNIKYFCRDPCKDGDVLVQSDQPPKGRYTLKDYGQGTFTVTITDLQESDSGIYWCGVDRAVKDTYHEVKLTVCKDNTWSLDEVTYPQTTGKQTSPGTNADIHSTTPSHSASKSSATKESTVIATGFVNESGNRTAGKKTVPVYYISYAGAGLAVLVIMCAVVLTAVRLCSTRAKNSRGVTANPAQNEHHSEEASGVYENASYDRPYATIRKSSDKSTDNRQSELTHRHKPGKSSL